MTAVAVAGESVNAHAGRFGKYRYRLALARRDRTVQLSSQQIGRDLGINATQVRRDFSALGRFGKRGAGYKVERLLDELKAETRVMITGDGPTAAILRDRIELLRPSGVVNVPLHESADYVDVVVIDKVDADAGAGLAAMFAGLGVPLIVNMADYFIDAPPPARVLNVSPLATLAAALGEVQA